MKWLLIFSLVFFISCEEKDEKNESITEELFEGKWIDLTYDFSDKTLFWPTANGFKLDTAFNGVTPAGFYYEAYKIRLDRKSTRLNSSHSQISYAVFCLKKKKHTKNLLSALY